MASQEQTLFGSVCYQLIQALVPTDRDRKTRNDVVMQLNEIVQARLGNSFSNVQILPFGSFASGLYCRGSDLDLAVVAYKNGAPVWSLDRAQQTQALRTAFHAIRDTRGAMVGRAELLLHARVPVIKFHSANGHLECDLKLADPETLFKCRFLELLTKMDGRLGRLYYLVKAWAQAHQLNDASRGTLNSWSLTLMVIFHLQQQQPPILPPLYKLFHDRPPAKATTRLDLSTFPAAIEAFKVAEGRYQQYVAAAGQNTASVEQLLASFIDQFARLTAAWAQQKMEERNDCISPWMGKRAPHHFVQAYQLRIEEPFNATDNTARAVGSNITGGRGNGGSVQSIAKKLKQAAAITRTTTEARAAAAAALVLFSPEGCSKLAPALLEALELREVSEQRLPGWAVSELDRGLLRWGGGQEERDMLQDAQRQAGLLRKAAAAAGQQQQRAAAAAAVALPTEVEAMLANLSIGSKQERGRQQQAQEQGQELPAQDAVTAATAAVHNLLSGSAPSTSRLAAAASAAGPSSHPLHSDATSPGTQLWQSKRASARKAAADEAQAIAQALLAHWPVEQDLSVDAIEAIVGQVQQRHVKPMTSQRVHAMLLLHQVLKLRSGAPLDIKITPKAGRQAAGEAGQAQAGAEDSAGPRKVPVDLANFLQVTQEWDRAEMEGILGFLRKKAGGGGGKEQQQQQKDAQQDKAAAAAAAIAAAAAKAAAKAAARPAQSAAAAAAAGTAAGSAPSSPLQRAALQHAARVQQELDEAVARAEAAAAAQQRFEQLLAQHGGVQHFLEAERIDAAVRRSGLSKAARARLQALLHLARLEVVKGLAHVIYKVQDPGSSKILSVKRLSSSNLSKVCEEWSLKQLQELQTWLESEAARLLQGANTSAGSGSSSAGSSAAAAAAVAANAMATAAVASLPAAQHAGSSEGETGKLDGVRSRSDAVAAAQLAAHDVLMDQAADAPPMDVRQVLALVQAARLPSTHSCQQRMACLLLLAEVQRQAGLGEVPYVMRHNGKEQRLVLSHDRLSADMAKWGMNQVKVLQAWLQQRLEQCSGGTSSSAGSGQQVRSDGSGTSSTQDTAAAVAAVPSSSTDTTTATTTSSSQQQHMDEVCTDAAPPSDSKSHSRALLQAQARLQQLEASEQPLLMELQYSRGKGAAGGLPLKDVGPQLEGWSTSQLKEFRDWADELLRQPVLLQQQRQQQEGLRAAAPAAEAVPG